MEKIRICKCGCNQKIEWEKNNSGFIRGHHMRLLENKKRVGKQFSIYHKDLSFEEQYGDKKSKIIKEKMSKNAYATKLKGKKYEEIYGDKKAKKLKNNLREKNKNIRKNLTYEEIYGKKRAKVIKEKQKKIKNISQIKNALETVFKNKGKITKNEFFSDYFVKKNVGGVAAIRKKLKSKNLTLDDIAKEIGYKFFRRVHLGKNETQILDDIEKENNIKLERQYPVLNFYIDGYDSTNNIVYEVDESHHKYQQIQDIIRKNKIKEELGCEFVRIKEEEFLNVKRNKN